MRLPGLPLDMNKSFKWGKSMTKDTDILVIYHKQDSDYVQSSAILVRHSRGGGNPEHRDETGSPAPRTCFFML